MTRYILSILIASALVASSALAQPPIAGGTATYEYTNSFVTRLLPNTPFNPGMEPVDVPVESVGVTTQVWEDQVGDTILDELTSLRQIGELPGEPPIPFEIIGGIELTPELGPFTGSLTSIEQDPVDGSLTSAFRTLAGPFAQVLSDGTYLYAIDEYTFQGDVEGLPFPVGTEFTGLADIEVDIRVRLGPTIDPDNDPVVAVALGGGNITITRIVPEPASALTAFVGLGILALRRLT